MTSKLLACTGVLLKAKDGTIVSGRVATLPSKQAELAHTAFHVLNQFDIPRGVVREKEGPSIAFDYTMFTSAKDPNKMRYYYRSYEDQAVKFVDLKNFNLDFRHIMEKKIEGQQASDDTSALLHDSPLFRGGTWGA